MDSDKHTFLIDVNFISWVQGFCDWIERKFNDESERRKSVYKIAAHAFFLTYGMVSQNTGPDSEISNEERQKLSSAWQDAAAAVREYDPEMFVEKSKYWLNPGEWTNEQISATGIALAKLEPRIRRLGLI